MKNWLKIVPLYLAIFAIAGCGNNAPSSSTASPGKLLEIQGYHLGMSEKQVLEQGGISCNSAPGKPEADMICNASAAISGQPGILFFYFYDNKLEKVALSVLPKHGYLQEINKLLSKELEMKYGRPATDNALEITWLQKEGAITVSHNDERTVTINLTSSKYENEKARRMRIAGGGVEI
ncbi:MAG: hypothetical protein OEV35_05930 [Gallionellaceae bacterium]|nr:hypothetical protein [Gallionellaceae bacterium]